MKEFRFSGFKVHLVVLIVFISFFIQPAFGWMRDNFYAESGNHVECTPDGGFIFVGGNSLKVWKCNSIGEVEWAKREQDFGYEYGCEWLWIESLPEGYILLGKCRTGYLAICKINVNGSVQWLKEYPSDAYEPGRCIKQLPDGNFILTGHKDSLYKNIKIDEYGNITWEKYHEMVGDELVITPDNGCIVVGWTYNNGINDFNVLKLDENGDSCWAYRYCDGSLRGITTTSDGNYVVANGSDIIKIDDNGSVLFHKTFPDSMEGYAYSVKETPDRGFILSGTKVYDYPHYDVWLLKTDENGNPLWCRKYHLGNQDRGKCIQVTPDGGFIIGGDYWEEDIWGPDPAYYYVFLLKLNSQGEITWHEIFATEVYEPVEGESTKKMTPRARFTNAGGYENTGVFYCHCEIYNSSNGNLYYHDSIPVFDVLELFEFVNVEFPEYTAEYNADCLAEFYVTSTVDDSMTTFPKTVAFHSDGRKNDDEPGFPAEWVLVESFGAEIILQHPDLTESAHVSLFDPSGRRIDEIEISGSSGTVTWGEGFSPGVYFIRVTTGSLEGTHKVVLTK